MTYKALYRKYRPRTFDDVVGQDHIVKALKSTILENKIGHAYLFCGTRGTGKTSVAKILAKSVNCLNEDKPCGRCENCIASDEGKNQDIIEMDAASNNGVDDIRNMIDRIKYAPSQGKYKVYIIDEVHMLSKGAFNALLKTLEEPPSHVIFILATTEPQKVIPTIISRCQRYNFKRVDDKNIIKRLEVISKEENIEIDEGAKKLIARLANGGMRDALSILDQALAYCDKTIGKNDLQEIYGLTTLEDKIELLYKIDDLDSKYLLEYIKDLNQRGIDFKKLTEEIIDIFKEVILYSFSKDSNILEVLDKDTVENLMGRYSQEDAFKVIDILMETSEKFATTLDIYSYFEIACLKIMALNKKLEDKKEVYIEERVAIEPKEIKKEEVISPDIKEDVLFTYDDETILSILVKCNKESKNMDTSIYKNIDMYDIENARLTRLLSKASIVASGEDCILLASDMDPIINTINEEQTNKDLYIYFKENLKIDKMIYAISTKRFKDISTLFLKRFKENSLPEGIDVKRYNLREEKESSEEKIFEIFGKENVEIL